MVSFDVVSVKYYTVKKDNYAQMLRQAKALLRFGYCYTSEPLKYNGNDGVIIFAKPSIKGIDRIKFDGNRDLLWLLIRELKLKNS